MHRGVLLKGMEQQIKMRIATTVPDYEKAI